MKPFFVAAVVSTVSTIFSGSITAQPALAMAQAKVDVLAIRCALGPTAGPVSPTKEKAIKIELVDFSRRRLAPILIKEPRWHSGEAAFQFAAPEGGFFAIFTDVERGCISQVRLVTVANRTRHLRIVFGHGTIDWYAGSAFVINAPTNLTISVVLMLAPVACGAGDYLPSFWQKKRGEYESTYDDGAYYGWLGGLTGNLEPLLSISASSREGRVLIKSAAFQKRSRERGLQHFAFTVQDYQNWLARSDEGEKVLCI